MFCKIIGFSARATIRSYRRISFARWDSLSSHPYSTDQSGPEETSPKREVGGFAQAFEQHAKLDDVTAEGKREEASFATLLRNSKFIDLGDPEGQIVTGTIFHVIGDDLYIDFGWKFHCVCSRPTKNSSDYVRGAKVRLRLKDLELSTKFLGSDKDLTILEADATILGLIHSPTRSGDLALKG